jgi:hypothetical protein
LVGVIVRLALLAFSLFFVMNSYGATSAEEITVTVDGKIYTCSETGSNTDSCAGKAASFSSTLNACLKTYNGGYCASTYWPKYKAAYPECAAEGVPACLKTCMKTYNGGYCAEVCQ